MSIIRKVEQFHSLIKTYSDEQSNYISIDPVLNLSIVKNHLMMGKWNCLYYGASQKLTSTQIFRIVPWVDSSNWFVGNTTPYFESVNKFRSFLISWEEFPIGMLIDSKASFDSYRQNWNVVLDAKLPIYELFGGTDGLKNLNAYVHDDSLWEKPKFDDEEKFARRKKLSLLMNDSASNQYLWKFIEDMQKGSFIPEVPTLELDMHEERILSAIADRAYLNSRPGEFKQFEDLYMQAVLFAHGFGAQGDDISAIPHSCETSAQVFRPIDSLLDEDEENSEKIKNMPEYHIALAMNEQKESYTGVAHIEVAAQMDDLLNEPKKAWKYLESAGYWAGKNLPAAQATILEAAIHLCNRHGWEEAEEVLLYNKRIMNA